MSAFDAVDEWFEKGFRVRQQKGSKTARRDGVRSKAGTAPASKSGVKFSAGAKAKNVKSVIRKAPEVMVKITGSSSGLATVKHHLDYISRNGEVELVNECDETLQGREDLRGLRAQLKAAQIPNESKKREFLHVVMSMPRGTPEASMKAAVAEFAREEFANRRYVMALHDDTKHVHMHICVGTRDIDRADEPRLSPRPADLYRWRQGFADKLREQGIEAAASERRHRFNHHKAEKGVVRQVDADDPRSKRFNAERAREKSLTRKMNAHMRPEKAFVGPLRPPAPSTALQGRAAEIRQAVVRGERPVNPAHDRQEATRRATVARWTEVAEGLERTGESELAAKLRAMLESDGDKPVRSANQKAYDAAVDRQSPELTQEL